MEPPMSSSVNPAGAVQSSAVSPNPKVTPESTAASSIPPGTGTPELRSLEAGPLVVSVIPPVQRLETAERGELTASLQPPLIPVLQSPVAQQMPERAATVAARPTTDSTLQEQLSSPTGANLTMARSPSAGNPSPSIEKLEDGDSFSGISGIPELHRDSAVRTNHPLPVPPPVRLVDNGGMSTRRQRSLSYKPGLQRPRSGSRRSNVDWIVPVDELKQRNEATVTERLQPTLDIAVVKRDKFAAKAKASGWALNIAIGLQVLFGSITTGLSAVASTGSGHSTAVGTTILGAMSTMVASYLARTRGSQEPELSLVRMRDLDHFIREIQAFMLDHGHVDTGEWDSEIDRFRRELDEIIVHSYKGLKAGPPGISA